MLARIADALGCSVEELQGDADDEEESDPVTDLVRALDRYVTHKVGRVSV